MSYRTLFALLFLFTIEMPFSCRASSSAAVTDPRSGPWESDATLNGAKRHVILELQIFRHFSANAALGDTVSGHIGGLTENGCTFNTKIAPQSLHLSLPCLSRINGYYGPDGRQLELSFGKDGVFATLIRQAHERLTVHLKRFPQDQTRSPLAGDWIARGVSQTCVLHVYTRDDRNDLLDALDPSGLIVSLDMLDSEEGSSGWQLGGIDYRSQQDNFLSFTLSGVRTEMFTGRIEIQQGRIAGNWPGHSDCSVFVRSIPE